MGVESVVLVYESHEAAVEHEVPSLYTEHLETPMTMHGITKTVQEWASMCPVRDDPTKFNPESMDIFVSKMFDRAGIDYDRQAYQIDQKVERQRERIVESKQETKKNRKPSDKGEATGTC